MPITSLLLLANPSPVGGLPGVYEGALREGDSDWPVRLEILSEARNGTGGDLRVLLDLPTLGMIAHEITVDSREAGLAEIKIPFGCGTFLLEATSGTLIVTGDPESSISLHVASSVAPDRPYVAEPITFDTHDGLTLEGTLYRPTTPGPHAGIVMLHGSSVKGRDEWAYRSWGPMYASMGLATLVFDKRPAESSDDLAFLAANGRAAHRWLRKQPGSDSAEAARCRGWAWPSLPTRPTRSPSWS